MPKYHNWQRKIVQPPNQPEKLDLNLLFLKELSIWVIQTTKGGNCTGFFVFFLFVFCFLVQICHAIALTEHALVCGQSWKPPRILMMLKLMRYHRRLIELEYYSSHRWNNTPMDEALHFGHHDVFKILQEYQVQYTPPDDSSNGKESQTVQKNLDGLL